MVVLFHWSVPMRDWFQSLKLRGENLWNSKNSLTKKAHRHQKQWNGNLRFHFYLFVSCIFLLDFNWNWLVLSLGWETKPIESPSQVQARSTQFLTRKIVWKISKDVNSFNTIQRKRLTRIERSSKIAENQRHFSSSINTSLTQSTRKVFFLFFFFIDRLTQLCSVWSIVKRWI